MRISDWSSDVCSSDLLAAPAQAQLARLQMNDDEFVAYVERNQRFGPVWPHQINGRNFPARRKPKHRELTIVGDLRRLPLARTLNLIILVAQTLANRMSAAPPNTLGLTRTRLTYSLCHLHRPAH